MKSIAGFVLSLLGAIGVFIFSVVIGIVYGLLGTGLALFGGLEAAGYYGVLIVFLGIWSLASFVGAFMMISDKTLKAGSIICIICGFFNLFLLIGGILGVVALSKENKGQVVAQQPVIPSSQIKTVKPTVVKQVIKEKKAAPVSDGTVTLQEDSKTWAFLGVFLTWIGYLIVNNSDHKTDAYAVYYAKQGLVLGIAYVIVYFSGLALFFLPRFISSILSLGVFVLYILAIINAFSGELKPLPLLGGFIK